MRVPSFLATTPGLLTKPASVPTATQLGHRSLSTSSSRARNLPARRPVDPLDTAPNAVRHRLPSGETFIVRAAPSAPGVRSAVANDEAAAASESGPSSVAASLFPGFANAARGPAATTLPPALRPRTRRALPSSATTQLSPEKISELRALRLSTAATSAPGSSTSVRALAARYNVSTAFVRIVAPLPADVRAAKVAEAEERSGREFWGFKKRLSRFERRVRREMW